MIDNFNLNKDKFRYTLKMSDGEKAVVKVKGVSFGDGNVKFIAGPCAVESREKIFKLAELVKDAGADMLRGGAFKPRTSPYDFQGIGEKGLEYLAEAGKTFGLPTVSEITDKGMLPEFTDIEVLQIGAKNMQNFELLKAVGRTDKPVLLKRGFSNTIEELLLSAEYILSEGNQNVILCERGIRTFEKATRNTFDVSAICLLKQISRLPVIADPSHATGKRQLVLPVSFAAAAVGVDGIMTEVHDDPARALCDGEQAITPSEFKELTIKAKEIAKAIR